MSSTFPVDDMTLAMLESACSADESDDGRSHLTDVLDGVHANDLILALITEIRRLRADHE